MHVVITSCFMPLLVLSVCKAPSIIMIKHHIIAQTYLHAFSLGCLGALQS